MKAHDSLIEIASSYIFVREQGSNRGRWVDLFNRALNDSIGHAWCAAFTSHCLMENDERFGFDHDLVLGEHVMTMVRANKLAHRLEPKPGYLICWNHKGTDQGHVGIVKKVAPTILHTIEGNTGGGKLINRDGDGVYERERECLKIGDRIGNMVLVAFLDPYHRMKE